MNGLGHIPNIFLCNFKILQKLPDYKKKYYNFYTYNRILFAINFFIFKVGGFTVTLYEGFYLSLIYDTWYQLFCGFLLTMLQYYWGYIICKKVYVKCKKESTRNGCR